MYYTVYKYRNQLVSKRLTKQLATARRQADKAQAETGLAYVLTYPGRELAYAPPAAVRAAIRSAA